MYNTKLDIPDTLVRKVVDKLKGLNITVDNAGSVLFVLFALYDDNTKVLDAFDNDNNEKRALLLYKDLELKGLIQESDSDDHFELTAIGYDLVKWIKVEFSTLVPEPTESTEKSEKSEKIMDESDEWIQTFINLWPAKSPDGYFFRQDKDSIKAKLQKFMAKYPYTKEEITLAAKAYLEDRYKAGYAYTKKVSNFISFRDKLNHDNQTSDLAAWCEYIINENKEKAVARPSSSFDDFLMLE